MSLLGKPVYALRYQFIDETLVLWDGGANGRTKRLQLSRGWVAQAPEVGRIYLSMSGELSEGDIHYRGIQPDAQTDSRDRIKTGIVHVVDVHVILEAPGRAW